MKTLDNLEMKVSTYGFEGRHTETKPKVLKMNDRESTLGIEVSTHEDSV